ncbi:MAG: hypothetical protein PHO14_06760 [Kiritimatiellae bacterium]|jgi:SAM-dependent methyltransferase|nr:hypothetical protein [Kiritimatiellia bacterium]MDD4341919.1 hypothetical protein [Kiritimatiellia bacterium]MDY0150200.1 hypothetical protein [Kiritimatiellia bacterium]
MSHYKPYFYSQRYEWTAQASVRILDLVLPRIPPVRSALDVGCGVGAWLAVLQAQGVSDAAGPLDLVHPEAYLSKVDPKTLSLGLALFRRSWKNRRGK